MAEQETATPSDAVPEVSSSFDDKLAAKLGLTDSPQDDAPQAADEATPEGELNPDDIGGDEPASEEGDWLELDRKGEKRKVSKEEAKRLAQQGWDYSTNQEQLKAERQAVAQERAAIQAKANITPHVLDAAGNVKFYENALRQYQNFDWVAYARDNGPQDYQVARAHFEQLKEGYQSANYQLNTVMGHVQQIDAQAMDAMLKQNFSRVLDDAPELRDPKRYQVEAERINGYLGRKGFSAQEINSILDSRHFAVARDAMRYAEALKARAERQTTTPTLKPGAAPQRANAALREKEIVTKLHRTKDVTQKKGLFEAALAAKLSRLA